MPNSENISLPLDEFIALPTTVPFYAWYTPSFQSYLADKPYIRLVKVLANDLAILCTNEENMETIFEELGSDFLSTYPEVYGLTFTEALQASGIAAVQQQPYLNLTGSGVIVGLVDTGIDYTNPVFRYEDGTTKIKYIWDQTAEGPQNYGVNFGTVYTSEQINEALASDDPYSIVPHSDESGHGTYLASLAAGRQSGEFIGAAPDADLIVVKLKKAAPFYLRKFLVPPEQENAYISIDIMLGLSFIFEQAGALGRPCSICLGLGTNFGGHNGQNRLENYISFLSNSVGTVISTAVGNESNARHHTQGTIENQGDVVPISVRVGENARTLSVYIWYSGWDKISFSLKSPTGEVINKIPFFVGTTYQKKLIFEKSTVNIAYHQNESRFAIVQITDV
ncbi:MAG: S8 family peptidase, partial [Clostridia bacterium]|nr:S8 family peptidase [Clostridia bacterium]